MPNENNINNTTLSSPATSETQIKSEFLQMWEAYQQVKNNAQSPLVFDWNAFNKATTNRTFDSKGKKYTKEQTRTYLTTPEKYEKQIRDCSIYLYNSIQEYKHLIDYMSKMLTHDYILVPDSLDQNQNKTNDKKLLKSFYETLTFIENYNIKNKLSSIESILLREDFYFGYERSDGENYIWQKLPSDFCRILGWDEFGCLIFEFDFSYFGKNGLKLENFDSEFTKLYNVYKNGGNRWQQLSDNAICFKFDTSVLYGLPYFSGLFTDLMGIEEYKDDQEDSNRANNYKLIALQIPIYDKDKSVNQYMVSLDHVTQFVSNAQKNTPEKVGIFASPMKAEALNLNSTTAKFDENIVAQAQNDLMTSAGVSKLIGNSEKTSIGLERSINDDEAVMFSLLKQYEMWFKKRLRMLSKGKYRWKIWLPEISIYNRDKMFERYLQAGNTGFPKAPLVASMGYSQADFVGLANLESQLDLVDSMLKVLPSSATTPGGDEGGNPGKSTENKTDSGIITDDKESNKAKTFEEEIDKDNQLEEEIE